MKFPAALPDLEKSFGRLRNLLSGGRKARPCF